MTYSRLRELVGLRTRPEVDPGSSVRMDGPGVPRFPEWERRRVFQEARGGYHVDREFRAVTDCRYGHVGVHFLNGTFPDQWSGRKRVHRRCVVDDCPWGLWSEWA